MTTTVRIQDADKIELDRLQAKILLQSGKKITHDQLLHYLLYYSKETIVDLIVDDVNDQKINWDGLMDSISDLGLSDSTQIDDIIYGED